MKSPVAERMMNKEAFKALVSKEKSNIIKNIKFRRKFRHYFRLKSYVILLYLNCCKLWEKE